VSSNHDTQTASQQLDQLEFDTLYLQLPDTDRKLLHGFLPSKVTKNVGLNKRQTQLTDP
jgi:hypothetical protein